MIQRFTVTFILLILVWIAFTGSLFYEEILVGIIVSFIIALFTCKNFIKAGAFSKLNPLRWASSIAFFFYMIYREIFAHLNLIKIILSPKLMIKPQIIKLKTSLQKNSTKAALANSITLTPGTLSIDLEDSNLTVHCIDAMSEQEILGKSEYFLRSVIK